MEISFHNELEFISMLFELLCWFAGKPRGFWLRQVPILIQAKNSLLTTCMAGQTQNVQISLLYYEIPIMMQICKKLGQNICSTMKVQSWCKFTWKWRNLSLLYCGSPILMKISTKVRQYIYLLYYESTIMKRICTKVGQNIFSTINVQSWGKFARKWGKISALHWSQKILAPLLHKHHWNEVTLNGNKTP